MKVQTRQRAKGLMGLVTVKVNIDFIKKVQVQECTLLISVLERRTLGPSLAYSASSKPMRGFVFLKGKKKRKE